MKFWWSAIAGVFLLYTSLTLVSSGVDVVKFDYVGDRKHLHGDVHKYDEFEDSSEYGVASGEVDTNCTCGVANKNPGRIIGGKEAGRHEYPMIAELAIHDTHFCGGAIITVRHVVSAAHCAFFPRSLQKLPMDELDVYVGIHEVSGEKAFVGGQRFGIEEFTTHPEYHFIGKEYDVGIILLDDSINMTGPRVALACLPLGNENIIGSHLKALGWGVTAYLKREESEVLLKVDILAVAHQFCKSTYKYYNNVTNICMYSKDKDTCQGDSGGPLLWRDPATNRYVVVAVVSYGRKCGELAAVNSNIIHFLPWIQQTISETDPTQKTCSKMAS